MKTQYSRRPRRLLAPNARILAGGVVLIIVVLIILRFALPGVLSALAEPLWRVGNSLTASVGLPESSASVLAERTALKAENEALQNEIRTLSAAVEDIGRLGDGEGVYAGVLARPPVSPYDVVIVSKGTADGVQVGALVYGPGGVPIGVVADTSGSRSHITLFSTAGHETGGWVGEERIPLTLTGEGAGAWSARVAADAVVAVGDLVYLPGPGAVPVGTVARIDAHPASPEAVLRVRPYVNPFTLSIVRIAPLP